MIDVKITEGAEGVVATDLSGFFVGWPHPPDDHGRLEILRAATTAFVARDDAGRLVGFVTIVTDDVFAATIPLLEVLPEHQHAGIGRRLVLAALDRVAHCYMVDLACDDDVVPFYERLGGTRLNAVSWRHHDRLAPPPELP